MLVLVHMYQQPDEWSRKSLNREALALDKMFCLDNALSYNQRSALQVAKEKHAVEVLMFSQKRK